MNSESHGLHQYLQGNPERRSKLTKLDGGKAHTPGEMRCSKGVCEVAWKPNQQNGREMDQLESIATGD